MHSGGEGADPAASWLMGIPWRFARLGKGQDL